MAFLISHRHFVQGEFRGRIRSPRPVTHRLQFFLVYNLSRAAGEHVEQAKRAAASTFRTDDGDRDLKTARLAAKFLAGLRCGFTFHKVAVSSDRLHPEI